ncbi:zinc ribbon domain-containing protein [Nocardia sp. NBC_01499]|uniref:zinc ribbon domain-containing protein n=1 Tax=Nocardia sp. NBC_01499 TaxID=2903597 RepID=UPI00386E0198
MAEVPTAAPCPDCASSSKRQFGVAALIRPGSAATRLIDATERTASEPSVVAAPPRRRSLPVTRNPLHRKLPRP